MWRPEHVGGAFSSNLGTQALVLVLMRCWYQVRDDGKAVAHENGTSERARHR